MSAAEDDEESAELLAAEKAPEDAAEAGDAAPSFPAAPKQQQQLPKSCSKGRSTTLPQQPVSAGESLLLSKKAQQQEPLCVQWPTRREPALCGLVRLRRVGNLYVLTEWQSPDGRKKRLYVGPYWHFLIITVLLLTCIACVVYLGVVPSSWTTVRFVGVALTVLSFASLACTAFADPGVFPRYFKRVEPNWTYCEHTNSFRPPRCVFCQECQVLVEDYNHFCPWTGIVIAKGNDTFFKLLLVSLVLSLLYDAIVVAIVLHTIYQDHHH